MSTTLTVVAGPELGRQIAVPAGDSFRVGRGENADQAFAQDLSMSSIHFQIDGRRDGGLLTDMKSTNGTFVNEKPVYRTVVADGDQILAGTTVFAVTVGSKPQAHVPAPQPAASKALAASATTVCEGLQLTDEGRQLLAPEFTVAQFAKQLDRKALHADALRVLSHGLGTPAAIMWSCECLQELSDSPLTDAEQQAVTAAKAWATDPSPENADQAFQAAQALENQGSAAMLATAAFWGAGSLAPPGQPVIPVDPQLTSQSISGALTLVAVSAPPAQALKKFSACISKALD